MHRKISAIVISLFLGCLGATASTLSRSNTDSLNNCDEVPWDVRLKTSLTAFVPEIESNYYDTGIQVYDITADSVLWQYQGNKVMRPASCQKILTTITVLDVLGATHKIHTKAYYTGNIEQIDSISVLHGDIYVQGEFDPTYSYEDLTGLSHRIKQLGIDSIDGRLLADISFKDTLTLGAGWCWDDEPSVFAPFLCPLMFDRAKLSPASNKYPKSHFRFNPAIYFLRTLANELKRDSIRLDIENNNCLGIKETDQRLNLQQFYDHTTDIQELLERTMRNSDNLYAEALFAQLCHINSGRYASAKDGAKEIYNVMRKAGVNTTLCKVADGCGLSPYDFISPSALVKMLTYAYKRPNIINYLYASLPTAGKNGTLEKRMTKGPATFNVHAKTGTVTGVSSLSGYVTTSNGHTLAFSIINNGVLKSSTAHNLQDRICQELAK